MFKIRNIFTNGLPLILVQKIWLELHPKLRFFAKIWVVQGTDAGALGELAPQISIGLQNKENLHSVSLATLC